MKKIQRFFRMVFLSFVFCLLATLNAWAEDTPAVSTVIPQGTELSLVYQQNVSSYHNREGDEVWFKVEKPIIVDEQELIPAGYEVKATVVKRKKGSPDGDDGILELQVALFNHTIKVDVPERESKKGKKKPLFYALTLLSGQEAYALKGDQIGWTLGQDLVVSEVVIPPALAEFSEATTKLSAQSVSGIKYQPSKRKQLSHVIVDLGQHYSFESAQVVAINGEPLKYRIPTNKPLGKKTSRLSFAGWDVVKNLPFEDNANVELTIDGVIKGGERFQSRVPVGLSLKK